MNHYYAQNRDLLINSIRGTWLEQITTIPQGSFYSLLEFNNDQSDPLDLAKKIVRDIKVSLTPGIAFGDNMTGFLRLCFACERNILEEALNRLINYKI
jgi:aspartate/methionine/tyrosine aminotransferase